MNPPSDSATMRDHAHHDHSHHHHVNTRSHRFWDGLGMSLSGLCAIHCAATPFLLLLFPLAGEMMENPWIHWGLALFVVPIGSFAFYSGYRHHGRWQVPVLGAIGLTVITGALLIPEGYVTENIHHWVSFGGSAFLIAGHWYNRRACHHD